jgi:Flp pilus assembly protein TadG
MRRRLEQGGAAMFARIFIPLKLRRATARFLNDQSGAVLALVAIVIIPVLIGGAALSIDLGFAFSRQRQMQVAADAAAYSGAASLVQNAQGKTLITTYYATEAINTAAAAGFTAGVNNVTAVSPSYDAAAGTVTVAISEQRNWALAGVFLPNSGHITTVQAVAKVAQTNDYCILSLGCKVKNPQAGVGIYVGGSASITSSSGCGMSTNCNSSCSVQTNGQANTIGMPVYTEGGYCYNSGTPTANVTQSAYGTADPFVANGFYSSIQGAAWPATTNKTVTDPVLVPNTIYADNVKFSNSPLNLAKGIYYFANGFTTNSTVVTGDEVTLVFGPNASISLNGSTQINIDQTKLPTSGVAIAGLNSSGISFSGNTFFGGQGALYFPNGQVDFTGSNTTGGASQCIQIVAQVVTLNGNTTINDNCAPPGNIALNFKIRLIQ